MYEIISSGGWVAWVIILFSIVAVSVIIERMWFLRLGRIAPKALIPQIWQVLNNNQLNPKYIEELSTHSPLGCILATGLHYQNEPRFVLKDAIESSGRAVAHDLQQFLDILGTTALVTPLLGLLGTVLGMIEVFSTITSTGVGDASLLASGISKALITTALGLIVAIPATLFHRYFLRHTRNLVVILEAEALKLVEILQNKSLRKSPSQ